MARFVSYAPFDIDTVNLYWYYAYGTDSLLEKNVNLTVDGQTYPDLFWTQGNDGYDHLELDFLGSGIAQDSLGNITAGTVNFVAEFDLNANLYRWYAEGISSDAVAIYNAALTPSNSDEIYLIQTALAGNDIVILSPFNDRMGGYGGDDIVVGGAGADQLDGGDGNDTVYSDQAEPDGYASFNPNFPDFYHSPTLDHGTEVDQITGGSGDDFVSIGYGDSADGGANGEQGDTLFLSLAAAPTGVSADFTNTTLTIGSGTITGFENVQYLEGSQFDDFFVFSSSPFPLYPFSGPSGGGKEISGLGGNDHITGGYYTNNIWGGDGNDVLDGRASQYLMLLDGGAGNDTLIGSWVGSSLEGGAGDDVLDGGGGADALDGGDGNDRVVYDPADDPAKVAGGAGTDTLVVQDLAAPMGFNLVAQGFELAEVTQTDTGANAWSSIVKLYDSGWALTKQTTANDDGSRVVVDLDPHNLVNTSQVWSSYDALSRLSSVDQIFDNGTRTFINLDEAGTQSWMQDWFAYDAQARLDSEDVHYDNGSRTFINLDQDGSKSWSQDWFAYDAQGRLDSEDVHYDNGTRTFINLDQDGSKSWSQDWFSYDAQGRLVSEDRLFDDGTHTFIRIDAAGSESWSQAWFTYDAQGRLDTQDVINDDGSRTFTNYDQAGTEPFSLTATLYHPDGTAYEQVTTWDDGHTTYTLI